MILNTGPRKSENVEFEQTYVGRHGEDLGVDQALGGGFVLKEKKVIAIEDIEYKPALEHKSLRAKLHYHRQKNHYHDKTTTKNSE